MGEGAHRMQMCIIESAKIQKSDYSPLVQTRAEMKCAGEILIVIGCAGWLWLCGYVKTAYESDFSQRPRCTLTL